MNPLRAKLAWLYRRRRRVVLLVALAASVAALLLGCLKHEPLPIVAGLLGLAYSSWRLKVIWHKVAQGASCELHNYAAAAAIPSPKDPPTNSEDLIAQLLAQGRHALLLRPEIVTNLTPTMLERTLAELADQMALVPEGEVWMGDGQAVRSDWLDPDSVPSGRAVRVASFLIDRFAVTNAQFRAFLNDGGYEQMSLWDPQIWPGVLDFIDPTGHPGPRGWREGNYPAGEDDFPVVGVNWYEACAYARWAGKRLATDAEWEKAASWPAQRSGATRAGRKFPWGDTLERNRANLWGVRGRTAQVQEFGEGVSVGGIHQMVGNVWEWTTGAFGTDQDDLVLAAPLRNLRGGAYDTYFPCQATCQFRSGDDPLARKHNIGFRCAVSVGDLALGKEVAQEVVEPAITPVAAAETSPAPRTANLPAEIQA